MDLVKLVVFGVAVVVLFGTLWAALAKSGLKSIKPTAPTPRCENCRFWDLEEGQAIMKAQPHFMQAAQFISPAEMARHAQPGPVVDCRDCGGRGKVGTMRFTNGLEEMDFCTVCSGTGKVETQVLSPPSAPYKARWDQFGACMNPTLAADGDSSCTWAGDSCKHFAPKDDAA